MSVLNAKPDLSIQKSKSFTWVLTTSDTGAPIEISELQNITVHNIGSTGTAQIEVSNDGTNFVGLTAALVPGTPAGMVANSIFSFPAGFNPRFMRVGTVAAASVTIVATGQKIINAN